LPKLPRHSINILFVVDSIGRDCFHKAVTQSFGARDLSPDEIKVARLIIV
jgi:hypothetical protein